MSELPPPPLRTDVVGDGPPVVLLHGQPGTGGDWQRVVPLVQDRYKLVVPDRPGYGRTGGSATGFAGNARAMVELLDRLGIERAVLVGHSWAGGIGLAAAISHPERVAGLVLVSSVGPGEHVGWSDRVLAAPVVGDTIAVATFGALGVVLGRSRVRSLADRTLRGRPHEAVVALSRLTTGGARVWHSFVVEQRALLDELPALGPGLGGIVAPTVVVHGLADHLVAPEVAEGLAAAIPGATLRVVPEVGHLLPYYRPQEVADALDSLAG